MTQCRIVGKIKPEPLRKEIRFAKWKVDKIAEDIENAYKLRRKFMVIELIRACRINLGTWSHILNILVKRIKIA